MLLDALKAVELVDDVRLAMSFHGFETYPPRLGRLRRRMYSAALKRCDTCWAVSRTAANEVCDILDMNRSRFDVVTNGVDVDRFTPCDDPQRAKHTLGLPTDRPVILCVGNLKPIKGHETLLAAVDRLAALGRSFSLVCVGRDYCDGMLHRQAAAISGQVQVRFVGPQDDVVPWLSAADVYVQTSTWEGMSNSLLEAMACGLPIVATSAGGTTDALDHGVTGLLVPASDAASLADALDLLIADPQLGIRLGAAAREHACTHFSLSASHARLAAQYERLADRRGNTPQ
jgi:glycosyltransferase involved in cell wall biosynthesis